jgi:8-oxo-dGTP diphosphatase
MDRDMKLPKPIIKAASACVWRGNEVLLIERGQSLGQGFWSLPGGKVEPGETSLDAAHRELLEETGIVAALSAHVGDFEVVTDIVSYVISCFSGHYVSGEALAQSDAKAVAWIHWREMTKHRLAPNTQAAVVRARTVTNI